MSEHDITYYNYQQNGQIGMGFPKTVYGEGVRIYAKDLLTPNFTSIRVTGMTSGATWNINITVNPGEPITIESPFPIFN